MENMYLSLTIDGTAIKKVVEMVKKELNTLGIKNEETPVPHISLAYTLGTYSENLLKDIVESIAEGNFTIKPNGFELLDSEYYEATLITLKLSHEQDLKYAMDYIAENCEVKSFNGKFTTHITILKLDGFLSDEDKFLLARYLEMVAVGHISSLDINGQAINMYNPDRELIFQTLLNKK